MILVFFPPQEQRVSDLQEEAGLEAFAAPRLKLRRSDLEDLPEPRRVRGSPAQRPGAPQQAAQQGGAELQHRGGAPPAGPLQVREVGEDEGGDHRYDLLSHSSRIFKEERACSVLKQGRDMMI